MAKDTATLSTDNRITTLVWWAAANHIPSCRGGLRWSASHGHIQLRPSEVQESKLMDQALTLFLYPYP
jgi:hypothetical protein